MKQQSASTSEQVSPRDDTEGRDRFLDPWRRWKTSRSRDAFGDIARQIASYEEYRSLRKRRRRRADQLIFELSVEAVVADLVHRHLSEPDAWLAVSLSNRVLGRRNRYRSPVLSKVLPRLLQNMSAPDMGWLVLRKGVRREWFGKGRVSTIKAGPRLVRRIEQQGLGFEDLRRDGSHEVIILKRPRESIWDRGAWVEYRDSDETRRYREEVRRINAWLEAADIECEPWASNDPRHIPDPGQRQLRRYFNGSFREGGRLFGGFWQHLPRETRGRAIRINGEPIATLDYRQSVPRLLYAREGIDPKTEDLYQIAGLPEALAAREGVKKVMNAMLFEGDLKRFPRETRKHFHRRLKLRDVASLIAAQHRRVAHHFGTGIGLKLMCQESEILVDVLLRLIDDKVVALPLHDAVLVPKSAWSLAQKIMESVFETHAGVRGRVEVKVEE